MVTLAIPSQLWKGMCGHDHTTYTIWLQLYLGRLVGSSLEGWGGHPTRAFGTFSSQPYLFIVPLCVCSHKRDWAHHLSTRKGEGQWVAMVITVLFLASDEEMSKGMITIFFAFIPIRNKTQHAMYGHGAR